MKETQGWELDIARMLDQRISQVAKEEREAERNRIIKIVKKVKNLPLLRENAAVTVATDFITHNINQSS